MKIVYHLTQCGTCQRIIRDLKMLECGFELRDIKLQQVQPADVDQFRNKTGRYDSLFSLRDIKKETTGLKKK